MQKLKTGRKKSDKTKPSLTPTPGKKVYLLWFVQQREVLGDIECFIGVYATERDARAAIDRVKDQPGFIDYPQGFEICPNEVGKDHWTEGFITC